MTSDLSARKLLPLINDTVEEPRESPDWVRISTASAIALRFRSGRFDREFDFGGINLLLNYESGCRSELFLLRPGPHPSRGLRGQVVSSASSGRWSAPTN